MTARVRGLDESVRAWNNARRSVPRELQEMLEEQARHGADAARSRLMGRAGGNRAKRRPSDIYATKGNVFIRPGFTTPSAEFGAAVHSVFGRRVPAASMSRRVFPTPNRAGYLVGPEFLAAPIAARSRELADTGLDQISRELDKAGVPRG